MVAAGSEGLVPHQRLVRHWKLRSKWSWWIHKTTGRKQAAAPFELTVVDESEMDELHGRNGVADWILRFPFCSCSSDLFTPLFTMFSTVAAHLPGIVPFVALISAPDSCFWHSAYVFSRSCITFVISCSPSRTDFFFKSFRLFSNCRLSSGYCSGNS